MTPKPTPEQKADARQLFSILQLEWRYGNAIPAIEKFLAARDAQMAEARRQLVKELDRAKKVIGTLYFAAKREGWETGPSLNDGLSAAQDFAFGWHETFNDTDELILRNWYLGKHSSVAAKHTEESNG